GLRHHHRVQRLAGFEEDRLVTVTRVCEVLLEEPTLYWRQGSIAQDQSLIDKRLLRQLGQPSQLLDGLILEELIDGDPDPFPAGPRSQLNADDRISSELEEVVADTDPFNA